MMKKIKELNNWLEATEQLTQYFILKYFGKGDHDSYWVADEIGGVLFINDYFFSMNDIVDFLICGYTEKQMFNYYDYRLNAYHEKELVTNIRNWKKLK